VPFTMCAECGGIVELPATVCGPCAGQPAAAPAEPEPAPEPES
jgi:hypothetical protein